MVERGNDGENLGIFMGGVGKSPRQQVTGERQTAPAHSNFKYISQRFVLNCCKDLIATHSFVPSQMFAQN